MKFVSVALLSLFLTTLGCGEDDGEGQKSYQLEISFDEKVGEETLKLNEGDHTNAAGNKYRVTVLDYLLTEIKLVRESGEEVDLQEAYLRDKSYDDTQSFTTEEIAEGEYTKLSFIYGVTGDLGVADGLPNEDQFNQFEWPESLGGGYHYMKFEGIFEGEGSDMEGMDHSGMLHDGEATEAPEGWSTFMVHTGPTQGVDRSVKFEIDLEDFTLQNANQVITITMDVSQWFTNPQNYDLKTYTGMIMGNATAQEILKENVANVFTVSHSEKTEDEATE